MDIRPRRLRGSAAIRAMTRETRISAGSLVYPLFIREGSGVMEGIDSLDGQTRYSPDTVARGVEEALRAGVRSVLLFGLPDEKDELGSGAWAERGVVQESVRAIKRAFGDDAYVITDVCLCEYTSHGHCGALDGGQVDNDATLPLLARTAVSHVAAGSDMVAPSDMMDGRVRAIRRALDESGYTAAPIMSYAVKYASAFYGPFRDAAGSAPAFGDRKSYQMDWHNAKEARKEALLDVEEGADIIMVKPAMSYLDIIAEVAGRIDLPVAAYSVSGEYAMIKAAAERGLIDEYAAMCETATGIFRAGADILVTYFAKELAGAIERGDIG